MPRLLCKQTEHGSAFEHLHRDASRDKCLKWRHEQSTIGQPVEILELATWLNACTPFQIPKHGLLGLQFSQIKTGYLAFLVIITLRCQLSFKKLCTHVFSSKFFKHGFHFFAVSLVSVFYSTLFLCVCVCFYVFQSHTHTLSLLTSATFSVSLILKWLWLRFGWIGVVSDSSLRFFRLYHFQSCIVCLMKSKSDVFIGGLRRELLFASQLTACLSKTHPCHLLQPVENHSLAILQVTLTSQLENSLQVWAQLSPFLYLYLDLCCSPVFTYTALPQHMSRGKFGCLACAYHTLSTLSYYCLVLLAK